MQQSSVLPTPARDSQLSQAELGASAAPHKRSRARNWLGPLLGLALLVATIHYVDPAALLARISQLQLGFILLGTTLIVPQLHCLALRWRLTAAQLGSPFAQRRALREYSLSMLLNLLLPFGIAGDALRVLRHSAGNAAAPLQPLAAEERPRGAATEGQPLGLERAFHSVLLERIIGQLVVIVWAVASLPLWFGGVGVWLSAGALAALALSTALVRRIPRASKLPTRSRPVRVLLQLSFALQRLLTSPRYLGAQFALSSVITLSIAVQLYCALAALGLSLSAAQATQLFPLMLLSMSVPLAFAGFGPREAVTAQLYDVLHLSAADGAAFALAFGAIMICTSLPCLLVVLYLAEPAQEPAS